MFQRFLHCIRNSIPGEAISAENFFIVVSSGEV